MPDSQDNGVELHGQFNIRQFAELLNLDATDTTRLANFIRKHKSGQRPTYQEVGAAARAFVGLVDADQEVTNKAAIMLKRVDAEPKMEDSSMMENKNKSVNEGIRVAKEGIEECWDDMGGQEMTQGNGEQMSVTISMPGKNISVTTDSADEIGSILRLAGINIGAVAPEAPAEEPTAPEADVAYVGAQSTPTGVPGDVDGDGDHDMADHDAEDDAKQTKEATQTPATWTDNQGNKHPATRVQGDRYGNGESDKEEEKKDVEEAKKPDEDGDGIPDWADKDEDEEVKENSARILALAGVTNEAQSAAQKAAFAKMIAKKNAKPGETDGDTTDDMASDKGEDVKEDAPATDSVFGQGVFEGEASAHDYIDYKSANGEEPPEQLVMQNGVEYDPDTGIISVKNATSLANTHRAIEAAGWQKVQNAARRNPAGATQAGRVGDTAYQLESSRILQLAGLEEGKLANSPAGTSMDEPTEFDSLPSHRGTGAGNKDYGLNRANNQGENPMSMHTLDIEESVEKAFEVAMGEYRKFVAENISRKK